MMIAPVGPSEKVKRQEHGRAGRRPDAREHPDERSEHRSHEGEEDVLRGQGYRETHEQILYRVHAASSYRPSWLSSDRDDKGSRTSRNFTNT